MTNTMKSYSYDDEDQMMAEKEKFKQKSKNTFLRNISPKKTSK